MPDKYFVTVTGSKNNAGDFLIRKRAHELLRKLRPDREVYDVNAWELFDNSKLDLVNRSEALILTGGPSLQFHMYPGIYKLRKNLDDITAPVTTLGIGWKSNFGDWASSRSYGFSKESISLLEKIKASGLGMSVRDYHSKNSLLYNGIEDVTVTGCPALFASTSNKNFPSDNSFKKVIFSLGVSFIQSKIMKSQMQNLIHGLSERYGKSAFKVAFHHTVSNEKYAKEHFSIEHVKSHNAFVEWLNSKSIDYVDVSGSAESFIDEYSDCDLHIGYRVHAHILMSSLGKRSILIAEDGRGKALRNVIGGMIIDGYEKRASSFFDRALARLKLKDYFSGESNINTEVIELINYDIKSSSILSNCVKSNIQNHENVMEKFIKSLP